MLRCCGAQVSWDSSVVHGAPFPETDEDIDFQVTDRPLERALESRFYVQPQYIIDSINAGRLLPVKGYMPGAEMPSHLSPFVDLSQGYVPPEYKFLIGVESLYEVEEEDGEAVEEIIYESADEVDDEEEEDEDEEMEGIEEEEAIVQDNITPKKKSTLKRKYKQEFNKDIADRKLIKIKEMEIPKNQRNLYNKMKYAEKKVTDVVKMKKKRELSNKKRQSRK